ncbi:hypothetical protein, conserved [Leishmania lindenbergi]|uniref:Uncharacterized protein n=1 Tax=Leishmania lindenbergi TaxID=651832 RepID=A0AAW2ZW49_9TRYP
MPVVCSFTAAVLLSSAPVVVDALSVEGLGHEERDSYTASGRQQDYPRSVTTDSKSTELSSSSSIVGSKDAPRPDHSRWRDLCGSRAYSRCVLTYVTVTVCVAYLFLTVVLWCLARWWRCGVHQLHRRHSVDDSSGEENDGVMRYRDAEVARHGLLSGRWHDPQDVPDSESARYRTAESSCGSLGTLFQIHNWILQGPRLWGVLQHTPIGLFCTLAQPTGPTGELGQAESLAVDLGEGAIDERRDSWNFSRDADCTVSTSSRASASSLHMHEGVFRATTASDSSDRDKNPSIHRDANSAEDSTCDRCCSRESDCSDDAHTEVKQPALCGVAADEHWSPFRSRTHVRPQVIYFNSAFDTEDDLLTSAYESTSSGSQFLYGSLAATTPSTPSAMGDVLSSHTPPPPTDTTELLLRDSGSSACALDADALHNTRCAHVALPYMGTALLDVGATRHTDLSINEDSFERGYCPPTLPSSAALCSTVGPRSSEVESVAPPSENAATAAPFPVLQEVSYPAVPNQTKAALPAAYVPNDRLDTMGGDMVEEVVDSAASCWSYIPTAQLRRLPAAEPPKVRGKRSSARYREPWQPLLVPCKRPSLAEVAGMTTLSTLSAPSSTVCNRVQRAPDPSSLGDDVDNLMLAAEVGGAQSNTAGDGTRVCRCIRTSLSRTLTLALGSEQGIAGTSVVPAVVPCSDASICSNLEPTAPLVAASSTLRPQSVPISVYSPTPGAAHTFMDKSDADSSEQCRWLPHGVGQRPSLNLSVEERTLLLRSRKWLFPLIDGTDEIE